ncbi:MFS transporter [Candidatus Parvarchaeota archaeon]|nr:MFS transporter [Candidatus Parvarchaeota archaeon]
MEVESKKPSLERRDRQNPPGTSKDLDNSIYDGVAFSVSAGIGDNYIPAAAILNGAGALQVGLLSAIPQFIGSLLQFLSFPLMRRIGSRKAMVLGGVALQSISWLAVAATMFYPGELSFWVMLGAFSLGVGISLMVNPAWASWIADLVPENQRPHFFASRNRLMNLALFVSTFAAGIMLRDLSASLGVRIAFALIFLAAFLARALTYYFHNKVSEPEFRPMMMHEVHLKHLFLLPAYKKELTFLIFISLMNFATQVASPFFTPYMLQSLGFDLAGIGFVSAVAIIVKVASLPYWGSMIDRFGNKKVLAVCSVGAALVPAIWLLSRDFYHILIFNAFSGFVWAGFDLCAFNYLLSSVSRELRASYVSKYNLFNGFLYTAGSLAGGIAISSIGNSLLFGFAAIPVIFIASTVMRLSVSLALLPRIPEKELPSTHTERHLLLKVLAVYPAQGAIMTVMHGWNITHRVIDAGKSTGMKFIHNVGSLKK